MRFLFGAGVTALLFLVACSSNNDTPPTPLPTDEPTATLPASATSTPSPELDDPRELLRQGDFEGAAASYLQVAGNSTDPEVRAQAFLGAGVAFHQAGDRPASYAALENALSEAPEGSRVRRQAGYVFGVRLNEVESYADAMAVLSPLVESPVADPLQPYIDAEFASAAARSNEQVAALATWERLLGDVSTPSAIRATIFSERASAAAAAGDRPGQLQWLQRYVNETGRPDARYQLGILAGDLGDMETFAAELRAVIANNPGTVSSILAIEKLNEFGVGYNLGEAGFAFYRAGRNEQARDTLLLAIAEDVSPTALTFRHYYLAAAYEALFDYPTAIAYYDLATTFDPESPYTHRSKWWAARLTEELGATGDAANRYLAMVVDGPEGEFTGEAAFRSGYNHLRAGNPSTAIATWAQVGAAADANLLYWQGRAHAALGDTANAEESYQQAMAAGPQDFHGLEAARELGLASDFDLSYQPLPEQTPPDWQAISDWIASTTPGAMPTLDTEVAADLVEVGLTDEAASLIDAAAGQDDPWQVLAATRAAYDLQLTSQALRLSVRLESLVGSDGKPIDLLRLQYPVDYVALLDGHAESYGFDPLFFAALIRQESLWEPTAGSIAGALGLTQVIPPTGEAIAAELGVEGWTPEDLFRPAVALEFGAYYLNGQLDHYENPYHALSAYNAGPGNAARWAESAPGDRPADFLATIDYSETTLYVELVTEHYASYLAAYRP